jgi:VWFA-related protein
MKAICTAMLLLLAWLTASASGQVFRVNVDGVSVDVLVTRGGKPLKGLQASDFTLLDNGVAQRIESVMFEDVPITLMLVLDTSASVKGELLMRLKGAARAAADALRADDRIGLLAFTHHAWLALAPPAIPAALPPVLDTIEAGGNTSVYDATFAVMALRLRTPGRMLMLVFTDGDDTTSWLDPRDVLAVARRSDMVAYGVVLERPLANLHPADVRVATSIELLFDEEPYLYGRIYLKRLVEESGGSLFVADASGLSEAFVRVVDEFRSRYVLTYTPREVDAKGWHKLAVRVKARGATVQARTGYLR